MPDDPWQSSPPVGRIDADGGADNPLIRTLLELVGTGQRRVWLKIPWWDVRVAEARQVLVGLIAAHQRGVDVRVIIRPDRECEATIKALRTASVVVKLRRNEHAKELLADDRHLFLSMNLTRKEILVNHQVGTRVQLFADQPADVGAPRQWNPSVADRPPATTSAGFNTDSMNDPRRHGARRRLRNTSRSCGLGSRVRTRKQCSTNSLAPMLQY